MGNEHKSSRCRGVGVLPNEHKPALPIRPLWMPPVCGTSTRLLYPSVPFGGRRCEKRAQGRSIHPSPLETIGVRNEHKSNRACGQRRWKRAQIQPAQKEAGKRQTSTNPPQPQGGGTGRNDRKYGYFINPPNISKR